MGVVAALSVTETVSWGHPLLRLRGLPDPDLVVLGMGNGMAALARAIAIAELYGAGSYGTIASVAASVTTASRAVAPVAAALHAGVRGYPALLWTLAALAATAAAPAWRAERAVTTT